MHDKNDKCLRCQMIRLINNYFDADEVRPATVEESRYILSCLASVSGEALSHGSDLDLAIFLQQVHSYRDPTRDQDGHGATKQ